MSRMYTSCPKANDMSRFLCTKIRSDFETLPHLKEKSIELFIMIYSILEDKQTFLKHEKIAIMLSFKLDSPCTPAGIFFGFCGMKLYGIL